MPLRRLSVAHALIMAYAMLLLGFIIVVFDLWK